MCLGFLAATFVGCGVVRVAQKGGGDGTIAAPEGLSYSADDVVYTYETVLKNSSFHNVALHQVFSDVTIQKLDRAGAEFKADFLKG